MTAALFAASPLLALVATAAALAGQARPALALCALAGAALAASAAAPGVVVEAPWLLLGVTLQVDPALTPAVAGAGLVWASAAAHALAAMRADPRAAGFAALFALALAGNATLLLAADVVTFYLGFSAMSLAAWGLVAHTRTPASERAARVYIAFTIAGELCLFAGLIVGTAAVSGATLTPRMLEAAPPQAAVALAMVGFAIKAGLAPLHWWLPLAHPAAPVPASAVLSGAMLKAGLVGLIKMAPPEATAAPTLGWAMVAAGLLGAYGGALAAASTRYLKTCLAYSSVSQLSLAMAVAGAGYAGLAEPAAVVAALALIALHHGLAKGALFLAADPGAPRPWAAALALIPALALTGAPLTLGAAAKAAAEAAVVDQTLALAVSAAAFATAVAMGRALATLAAQEGGVDRVRLGAVAALAAGCVLATRFAPWLGAPWLGAPWPGVAWPGAPDLKTLAAPALCLAAAAAFSLVDRARRGSQPWRKGAAG